MYGPSRRPQTGPIAHIYIYMSAYHSRAFGQTNPIRVMTLIRLFQGT